MFNFNEIKNTKRKFDVNDDNLKKRNFKKQKSNHRKIDLLVNDDIITEIKKNEKKHQQILNDDEKFMSHNMIQRLKVKNFFINQFDCFSIFSQSTFHELCNRRNARIAARQINVDIIFSFKSLMKDS